MAELKLVVSNPTPIGDTQASSQSKTVKTEFTVEVKNRGPYLYEMSIQDPVHCLECTLTIEIEETHDGLKPGQVICHFATIEDESLRDFVNEDETLYGMVMVQFQMKVLELLLLFCSKHYVSQLILYTDDRQAEQLGIYEDFLLHQNQTLTLQGEKTEIFIPVNPKIFADWLNFMAQTTVKFMQELWREQSSNPIIREYLKNLIRG
jgi:hypothetical protein